MESCAGVNKEHKCMLFSKKKKNKKQQPRCKEFVYSMEILYKKERKFWKNIYVFFVTIYVHRKQKAGDNG